MDKTTAEPDDPAVDSASEADPQPVLLNVENLTKVYPDGTLAVDDISFQVREGEFCVIIGPSGCGKTTTLHSLIGKVQLTSGSVLVGGEDMVGTPTYERDIGLVFQDFQLFPHMTVEENVRYGLERHNFSEAEIARRTDEYLELINLSAHRDREPEGLSAGQKQRVALARSLALEPELVLLDEPLGDLDYKLQKKLERELLRIQRETEATFVYVTHDQTQAMRLGDKIVVMNDGRIEQVGTVEDVYHSPDTAFVATFVGDSNIFFGEIASVSADGERVSLDTPYGTFRATTANLTADPGSLIGERIPFSIRPQYFELSAEAGNTIEATVVDILHHPGSGTQIILEATSRDGDTMEMQFKSHRHIEPDSHEVTVSWQSTDCILLEETSVFPDIDLEADILSQE